MQRALRVPVFTPVMIWTLVVMTLLIGFPPEAAAMLAPAVSPTSESASGPNRAEDLGKIQRVLEFKVIQQRLQDFGLTPDEIDARLSQLSDAQLHQTATHLDALIPGGELGLIIALLVIAILVVILLLLFGKRLTVQ